jgi:proline dehydrogenase
MQLSTHQTISLSETNLEPIQSPAQSALKTAIKIIAYRLSNVYRIEPSTLNKGLGVCSLLSQNDIPSTLGKFSTPQDAPEQIAMDYQRAFHILRNFTSPHLFYISIKPPALHFRIDQVTAIADAGLQNGFGIHFDSHDHCLAEPTLQLLKHAVRHTNPGKLPNQSWTWGLTLPSRWKRSVFDARWAVENNIRVRLVKGEFRAKHPSEEMNPKTGFIELIDQLQGIPEIAIATHDYKLAEKAIGRAKKVHKSVELELLYGMPVTEMILLAKAMDIPVRFYIAYGEALLIYGIKHLMTSPHKLVRKHSGNMFAGHDRKLSQILKHFY